MCKLASKMDKRTNIPVNSGNQVGSPSLHSSQCIRKLDLSVHAITLDFLPLKSARIVELNVPMDSTV